MYRRVIILMMMILIKVTITNKGIGILDFHIINRKLLILNETD